MSLHAIDDIGDAIDATKALLTPVSVRQWVKLAVVVFFIGGGGGGFNMVRSLSNLDQESTSPGSGGGFELAGLLRGLLDVAPLQTGVPPEARQALAGMGLVALVVIAGVALLVVAFAIVSNFMEFVFVESLVEREVRVLRYFGGNVWNGLRLLGFRLAVNLLSLVAAAAVLYAVFVLVLGVNISNLASISETVVFEAIPYLIVPLLVGAVVVGLVRGFTNNFVVPLMVQGDHGVLAGWQRLWSSVTDQPKQYVAYVFFSVVLGIGTNFIVSMLSFILLIPFGIVAFLLLAAAGESFIVLCIVFLLFAIFFLIVLVFGLLVRVPLQSFLRYYAMVVLGDIDASLDPIPEVRRSIRPDDSDTSTTPSESA